MSIFSVSTTSRNYLSPRITLAASLPTTEQLQLNRLSIQNIRDEFVQTQASHYGQSDTAKIFNLASGKLIIAIGELMATQRLTFGVEEELLIKTLTNRADQAKITGHKVVNDLSITISDEKFEQHYKCFEIVSEILQNPQDLYTHLNVMNRLRGKFLAKKNTSTGTHVHIGLQAFCNNRNLHNSTNQHYTCTMVLKYFMYFIASNYSQLAEVCAFDKKYSLPNLNFHKEEELNNFKSALNSATELKALMQNIHGMPAFVPRDELNKYRYKFFNLTNIYQPEKYTLEVRGMNLKIHKKNNPTAHFRPNYSIALMHYFAQLLDIACKKVEQSDGRYHLRELNDRQSTKINAATTKFVKQAKKLNGT